MCPRYLFLQGLLCLWLFTNGKICTSATRTVSKDKVYVDIKPSIYRSNNVIKIDSTDKRIKRGETDERLPSLVLEFTPGFFSNPLLQNLYAALTGGQEAKNVLSLQDVKSDDNISLKREIIQKPKVMTKDPNSFHLTIKPKVPKRLLPVRNYNNTCLDRPSDDSWCTTLPSEIKCDAFEPTPQITTTCHPTIPMPTKKFHFCAPNMDDHFSSHMPCVETTSKKFSFTEFQQCKSSPPPTVKPLWCNITTVPCRVTPSICETRPTVKSTYPPLTQKCPTCGVGQTHEEENIKKESQIVYDNNEPDRYILLFKRSPFDSRSNPVHKKKLNPNRRKILKKKKRSLKKKHKYYNKNL